MPSSKLEELEKHQLESYIKKEIKSGFSIKEVKKALIKAGHPRRYIDEAIRSIKKEEIKIPIKYLDKKIVFTIIITMLILAGIFTLIQKKLSKEIKNEEKSLNNIPFVYNEATKKDIELLKKAAAENNIDYCKEIKSEVVYYDCINKIWINDRECRFAVLTKNNIDMCFYNLATTKKEIRYCEFINDSELNRKCHNNYYNQIEMSKCAEIPSCVEYWLENKDNMICEKTAQPDFCYEKYSRLHKNWKSCNKIKEKRVRDKCIFRILPLNESKLKISERNFYLFVLSDMRDKNMNINPEMCDILNITIDKVENTFNISWEKTNEEKKIIKEFSQVSFNDVCYCLLVILEQNKENCRQIKNKDIQQICFSYGDQGCELIKNEKLYKLCNIIKDIR